MAKQKRTALKKDFFSGKITALEFITALEDSYRYRGFHSKPDKRPRWSGPFRDTRAEADLDNAPYFNAGYNVDIYIEQYV
jgi:hypothetical protein